MSKLEYFESWSVPDTFANQLVNVEHIGPCARLTFTIPTRISAGDRPEQTVVAKLILPLAALAAVAEKMLAPPPEEEQALPVNVVPLRPH